MIGYSAAALLALLNVTGVTSVSWWWPLGLVAGQTAILVAAAILRTDRSSDWNDDLTYQLEEPQPGPGDEWSE